MWGHHPALGAPFLSPACRIDTGARTLVVDADYDGLSVPLPRNSRHEWQGVDCDAIRRFPPAGEPRDLVAYLLEFEHAWWAVTNHDLGVGFGMAWDAEIFPVACMWQELGATTGFPWFGRGYALAIEPNTSWPAAGISKVARTTGTQGALAPGESLETQVCAVVYDSPWGVSAIDRHGTVDVTHGPGSSG
jgi:uncharacterized protein DUF4432